MVIMLAHLVLQGLNYIIHIVHLEQRLAPRLLLFTILNVCRSILSQPHFYILIHQPLEKIKTATLSLWLLDPERRVSQVG